MSLKKEIISVIFIFIISFFLVSNVFLGSGRATTFDGPIHQILIAQYTEALKYGEIPVTWADGYANYGMPMPLILHQTTSYTGAFLNLILKDVLLTYNLLLLLSAFISTLFFYIFLRFYVNQNLALLGAFLFNFAPYRIINVYIRGALPEFFGSIFIALILISIYLISQKRTNYGFILLTISSCLLFLTHPFTLGISLIFIVPYLLFNIFGKKDFFKTIILFGASLFIGVGMASFYAFPLFLELKYFYYGLAPSRIFPGHFMSFKNYFNPNWYYFSVDGVYTRPQVIKSGLIESIVVMFGVVLVLFKRKLLSPLLQKLLVSVVISAVVLIFFTIELSNFLYEHIPYLASIQHPWRMFSVFIFIPPIILVILVSLIKKFQFLVISGIMILVSILSFPQIYSKNSTITPESSYYFILENPDSESFNTIWTGPTESYPVKKMQGEIIDGKGEITKSEIRNSKRIYAVTAETPLRLVDYTFYFPGWNVYIDGARTPIEFQDPNYRGVITYKVATGKHEILLKFEDTKVRLLGKIVSVISVCFFGIFIVLLLIKTKNKRINKFLQFVRY